MGYVSELADVVAGVTYTWYHMSKHSYDNVGNINVHNYLDNNNANNDNDHWDANLAMQPKRWSLASTLNWALSSGLSRLFYTAKIIIGKGVEYKKFFKPFSQNKSIFFNKMGLPWVIYKRYE